MSEVIVVTSGKGGVGKTTTAANLGAGFALLGKKVILVDADIGLRNLDVVMGLENRIIYDLVDVVEGNCSLPQAIIRDKRFETLYLLPAAQTRDKEAVTADQMGILCRELLLDFEYVIVDCPAGIEQGFRSAIAGADRAVVVTTPEVSAIRDADRVIGLLEAAGKQPPLLVVNRIRPHMVQKGDMMDINDIVDILAIDLLGVIPEDEYIVVSTNRGEPAVANPTSLAGQAYKNISRRLCGENVPIMDIRLKKSFWKKIKELF
jgi:septum site-determining protein MinD